MSADAMQSEAIPLNLATLEDIAAELDRRRVSEPYLFVRRSPSGFWQAISDGMSLEQSREVLGVLDASLSAAQARADQEGQHAEFAGRRGGHYFEGSFESREPESRRRAKRLLRDAVLFLASCFTVAAMLRLMR